MTNGFAVLEHNIFDEIFQDYFDEQVNRPLIRNKLMVIANW